MGFVLFIHVVACVLLVITILMQAGRGGGLAESFSSAESMFGTQANSLMVRISTVLAAIFLTTSLVLAVYGSKGDKSLMITNKKLLPAKAAAPQLPLEPEVSVKVEAPKAMTDPLEQMNLKHEPKETVSVPTTNAAH